MNILLVLISDGWGGAENVVYNLAKQLSNKGENITVLLNGEVFRYFSDLKNVKILRMPSLYNPKALVTSIISSKKTDIEYDCIWNSGPFYYLNYLLRYLYYKKIHRNIIQMLKQQKVDIIHLHRSHSLKLFVDLLNNLNLPVICTLHGAPPRALFERSMKTDLTRVDEITCVSKYTMKVWQNHLVRKRFIVILNGVNISDIRKTSKKKLKGSFKLFFPGGGKFWKGGRLLVAALPYIRKEIPDVHLYVTGQGTHVLRKLIEDKRIERNVSILGFLETVRHVFEVLKSTDLLVFPSENEPFGIVLLEAMALGKPIVATNMGGIPEVVKHMRNGILVERDPRHIAEAVIWLYRNKDLYEKISENNLKDVERFDWNKIVDSYLQLYERCIENRTSQSQNLQ